MAAKRSILRDSQMASSMYAWSPASTLSPSPAHSAPQAAFLSQFESLPKTLNWEADGWELVGQKTDGTVDGSIQLIRTTAEAEGASNEAASGKPMAPGLRFDAVLILNPMAS